ncbi:MAG: hypothetical protein ACRC0L_07165, partial [Angustibacter sp.]
TYSGAVGYVEIINDNGVLGFIWFSEGESASGAGTVRIVDGGDLSGQAVIYWGGRLRAGRALEVSPEVWVRDLRGRRSRIPEFGWVDSQVHHAESVAELRRLANPHGRPPRPGSSAGRGESRVRRSAGRPEAPNPESPKA